jgi:hypothetical protein
MKLMRRLVLLACGLLLVTLPPGGRAAPPEAPSAADLEKQVKALVRQLRDDDFRQRQDAHRALVRLGPDVVPILDNLGPPADAEVRRHLQQIRQGWSASRTTFAMTWECCPTSRRR